MKRLGTLIWVLVLVACEVAAQPPENCPPDGLMKGFPPPAEKQVTTGSGERNWAWAHNSKWSYQHMRELLPTRSVARGTDVAKLPPSLRTEELNKLVFDDGNGKQITFKDFAEDKDTDYIMVLHRGEVVYEHPGNCMKPESYHLLYSASKSFVGLVAAIMVSQKQIDEEKKVWECVPELANSVYKNASVRDLMDMRVDVEFPEKGYVDLKSEFMCLLTAAGWIPSRTNCPNSANLYRYLETRNKKDPTDQGCFRYKSPTTDVLAWVVSNESKKSLSTLVSELIWSKIGAEHDAYYVVDALGKEAAFGGLNATIGDFARFGQMMLEMGNCNGQKVVPGEAIEDIRTGGGNCKVFPDDPSLGKWSYRSQWWRTNNPNGAYMAEGVYGQRLYIDPKAKIVVAKFGSYPEPGDVSFDRMHQNAFDALAKRLQNK
jgi:CubicO group peptidase (beta-lactamase class C family)